MACYTLGMFKRIGSLGKLPLVPGITIFSAFKLYDILFSQICQAKVEMSSLRN